MNKYTFLLGFLFLTPISGCNFTDSQLLIDCETNIKAQLISPSSYKRIKVSDNPIFQGLDIEYEAVNAYNVRLRDTYSCNPQMIELGKKLNEEFKKNNKIKY